MSLVKLTHRKLVAQTAAGATIPQALDALWACVDPNVTTYEDGSTRSFSGAGATGWTWTRVQVSGVTEALYCTPPGGSLAQRVIIAGRATAPTPSPIMISPEVFTGSAFLVGVALEAGTFTTWNATSPFTSGRWSGYTRLGNAVTGLATPLRLTVIESQETIVFQMLVGSATAMWAGGGAYVDPETTSATACETDGRRYGLWTTGNTANTGMMSTGLAGYIFTHTATQGPYTHTYLWRPGIATLETVARNWVVNGGATPSQYTNAAGEFADIPIWVTGSSTGWAGRVRELNLTRSMLSDQKIVDGATMRGYALAPSTSTAGDTLLAKY
jgi:hypothetical protein